MNIEDVLPLLARIGSRRRGGDVFTIDLAHDVLGWLGLNRATRHRAPGDLEVNPVVGVRFQEVERLVAECRDEKFHAYLPPTISTAIGYVMPEREYRAWVFVPPRSDATAINMVDAIASHGLAFMRSIPDLVELRRQPPGAFDHLALVSPCSCS